MTISYSGNFFQVLTRWRGSIWKAVWRELLIYLVMYYAIRVWYRIGIDLIFGDHAAHMKHEFGELCHMFYEYTHAIPLTFLLGFYVHNVVDRWWHQFKCLKWPEDIMAPLCVVIPKTDERSQKRRHTIARYVNLSAALAWRDVSPKLRHRFPTVIDLVKAGLMTEEEYNIIEEKHADVPSVRWLTPLHWAQQIMEDEDKDNKPNAHHVHTFYHELAALRESLRELYCFDWVCVPLVYTQVTSLATYAYFFLCLFGDQFVEGKDLDLVIPVISVIKFIFFIGWYKVGQDLMRPFGLDDDDIELSYILDRNVATSFGIVSRLQNEKYPDLDKNTDIIWNARPIVQLGSTGTTSSKRHRHNRPELHAVVNIDGDVKPTYLQNLVTNFRRREARNLAW
ncbi:unnamed protein product, partial [Mesorhabditis belari]|uniref:Bestrophin homolog n=1 Tax=Mesorhabditis belari TaxID=2138241 RepID=A0AAF3FMI3_9BILA